MSDRERPPIRRRIQAGIATAVADGLEPKSIYLTPDDREELLQSLRATGEWRRGQAEPEQLGGLPLKRVSDRGRSQIYCRHGVARAVPLRLPP